MLLFVNCARREGGAFWKIYPNILSCSKEELKGQLLGRGRIVCMYACVCLYVCDRRANFVVLRSFSLVSFPSVNGENCRKNS
jgi:hypothetical protein